MHPFDARPATFHQTTAAFFDLLHAVVDHRKPGGDDDAFRSLERTNWLLTLASQELKNSRPAFDKEIRPAWSESDEPPGEDLVTAFQDVQRALIDLSAQVGDMLNKGYPSMREDADEQG
jgi:hypothetical protein